MKRSRSRFARPVSAKRPAGNIARRPLRLEALEGRMLMAQDVVAGLGVVGDDWSDEYAARPAYSYAQNWVELLATRRAVNLGELKTHVDPDPGEADLRGTGYGFNWSLTGSSVLTQASLGPEVRLFQQIADPPGGVPSHAVIAYGQNDFNEVPVFGTEENTNPEIPYFQIYNNVWTPEQISDRAFLLDNLLGTTTSILTLGSQETHVVLATIPDPGDTPYFRNKYPSVAGRERVTAAIQTVNNEIRSLGQEFHIPVVDLFGLSKALLGTNNAPVASRSIGGVSFSTGGGTAKTNLFVQDGQRPHTVMQAAIANAMMAAYNRGYGAELTLFSEAEMVALAGQTYGGSNTLNLNYANFVTLPQTIVHLDFGASGTAGNDFGAQVNQLASTVGMSTLSEAEITQLKTAVQARLQTAFAGTTVSFASGPTPEGSRFHQVRYGRPVNQIGAERNVIAGHFEHDWRNLDGYGVGHILPTELGGVLPGIGGLSRSAQLQFLGNALGFYSVQGVGLSFGLSHADALGRPAITPANYANTGGVQNVDYMSGNPAFGFDPTSLQGTPNFSFSPLGKAKLQLAVGVSSSRLATTAEATTAHNTSGAAQDLTLQATSQANVKAAAVRHANIATAGQVDFYKVTVPAGQLITAQTLLSLEAATLATKVDTVLQLIGPDGATVVATSDDTRLGNNSFDQTGTTVQSSNSLVLNYQAAAGGTYFIRVTGRDNTTGEYDLFVSSMTGLSSGGVEAWHNAADPMNVDGEPGVVPLDVLLVINELNNRQYSDPDGQLRPPVTGTPPPYLDVTGDGYVVALDALVVINFINSGGSGEGEASTMVTFANWAADETNPAEGEGPAAISTASSASLLALEPNAGDLRTATTSSEHDLASPAPEDSLWLDIDWLTYRRTAPIVLQTLGDKSDSADESSEHLTTAEIDPSLES